MNDELCMINIRERKKTTNNKHFNTCSWERKQHFLRRLFSTVPECCRGSFADCCF